jgi:hypothetical protein
LEKKTHNGLTETNNIMAGCKYASCCPSLLIFMKEEARPTDRFHHSRMLVLLGAKNAAAWRTAGILLRLSRTLDDVASVFCLAILIRISFVLQRQALRA